MNIVMKCMLVMLVCASLVPLVQASQCSGAFTSTLSEGNTDLAGAEAGPYGTVCVDTTSTTTATITFTSFSDFLFGDGSAAGVNVNAGSFAESFSSESRGGSTLSGVFKDFSSGTADGFGTFNLLLDNNNFSPDDRADTIVFTVTNLSGTWASAADVLAGNAGGFDAVAHMMALNGNPVDCSDCVTGFAAEGGAASVPEPRSYGLVLSGLMVFGIVVFRRRRLAD